MGPNAVIVEDLDVTPAQFAAVVRDRFGDRMIDVVPGASSVLITANGPADEWAPQLAGLDPRGVVSASTGHVDIPVVYDGEDLAEVATTAGLTVGEVVELHSSARYTVDFCGFSPGFGYLSGLPPELHVPRRSTPRTRVPAGSVAIAASYSAVYPRSSPGGWHLLGRTDLPLFDPMQSPPAVLSPGTTVSFVPTDGDGR